MKKTTAIILVFVLFLSGIFSFLINNVKVSAADSIMAEKKENSSALITLPDGTNIDHYEVLIVRDGNTNWKEDTDQVDKTAKSFISTDLLSIIYRWKCRPIFKDGSIGEWSSCWLNVKTGEYGIDTPVNKSEEYKYWMQYDYRWTNLRLGSSNYSVGGYGCLVTSMCKLIIQAGLREADSFDVGTFVYELNASGGLNGNGDYVWGSAANYGLNSIRDIGYSAGNVSLNDATSIILDEVKAGHSVLIYTSSLSSNGPHYVAVDNSATLASGEIVVLDSGWTPAVKRYASYWSDVRGISVYEGGNPNDGYTIPTPENEDTNEENPSISIKPVDSSNNESNKTEISPLVDTNFHGKYKVTQTTTLYSDLTSTSGSILRKGSKLVIIAKVTMPDNQAYAMTIDSTFVPLADIKKTFSLPVLKHTYRTVTLPNGHTDAFSTRDGHVYKTRKLISVGENRQTYVVINATRLSTVPYKQGAVGDIIPTGTVLFTLDGYVNAFDHTWLVEENSGLFIYSGDLKRTQ